MLTQQVQTALVACGGCILVVDDDVEIRDALREYIESLGRAVVVAVDGIDALDALTRTAPCLVLLDLNMPRLDGEGFVRSVRRDACRCRLAIASMTAEYRRVPPETEAHFHTPFHLDELDPVIQRFCRLPVRAS
jgi:CheY-like chemotaxis protein